MYKIVVLKGDGIGPEVINEGLKVLDALTQCFNINFDFYFGEIGANYFKKTGKGMEPDLLDICKKADAIYLGAVGLPNIKDYPGGDILKLRRELELYANLRPIKLYPNVISPINKKIDLMIVRENLEGLYSRIGGYHINCAIDMKIATEKITERICNFAFNLAINEKKSTITCCDKSNVLLSCKFFREIFIKVAEKFKSVRTNFCYVDALAHNLILRPEKYEIILTPNLFGDILSDLAAALVGGLGMAPSANIGDKLAMFEPVHGSAPDIAGRGIANPVGAILSAKLMMDWFGEKIAAQFIEKAVISVLEENIKTPDLFGTFTTSKVGSAVAEKVRQFESD
jgi:isopropylmalate/isohomocitrate dehydrogenase-like protein